MNAGAKERGARISAHLPTLYLLARQIAPLPVVECGVGRGYSTAAFLAGVHEGGGHLTSYEIDPGCFAAAIRTMGIPSEAPELASWHFVHMDSVQAAGVWENGSVGLLFLDTIHTLEVTRCELEAWLPKMAPHGIMCGHDYLPNPEWPDRAVAQAVGEFLEQNDLRFRLQVLDHDQGLFILWPKSL